MQANKHIESLLVDWSHYLLPQSLKDGAYGWKLLRSIEYVVVTNDQVVLQPFMQYKLSEYANQVSAMRITTAANLLLLAQTSLHHEGIAQSDAWWSKLQTAEALLRAASTHDARNNKPESIRNAEHCINLCSEVLRSSWLRATAIYADPRSTPFLSSLASLPLHWQFHQLVRGRPWQSHVVPAAEFHDLQVMQQSGWTQDRRMLDRIEHQFAIVDSAGSTGHRAMFLSLAVANRRSALPVGSLVQQCRRVAWSSIISRSHRFAFDREFEWMSHLKNPWPVYWSMKDTKRSLW